MMKVMAVYTHLSDQAIRRHMRHFRVGEVVRAKGVAAGTINTIYDVTTTRGHFILRILEGRSTTDARYEEALLSHLALKELRVPRMLSAGRRGRVIALTARQQLSLFQYVPGREMAVFEIRPTHCRQIGAFLAAMHLATRDFRRRRRNRFSPDRVRSLASRCLVAARKEGTKRLRDIERLLQEIERHDWPHELPQGVIHGDLFIDNVRFSRGKLCGVLDFEMASSGLWAYDIAVALCDWGFLHDTIQIDRCAALLDGYQQVRPLSVQERQALFDLCRYAAARFAVSRFFDFEVNRSAEVKRLYKDYQHFMTRLQAIRALGCRGFPKKVGLSVP